MADTIYAKGTIKIKNADGLMVPFYPKTKTGCVVNIQSGVDSETMLEEIESNAELAAASGSIKCGYTSADDDSCMADCGRGTLLTAMEPCADDEWVVLVDTTDTNGKTAIPFNLYNTEGTMTVDWGDGQVQNLTSANYNSGNTTNASLHTYAQPGIYMVTMKHTNWKQLKMFIDAGSIAVYDGGSTSRLAPAYYFNRTVYEIQSKLPLMGGTQYYSSNSNTTPVIRVNNAESMFYNCCKLKALAYDMFINYSKCTSFASCFSECTSLVSIPPTVFKNCISATNFSYCFSECDAIESIPSGLFADAVKASSFNYCFYYCKHLKRIPIDLFTFNTEVNSFGCCFYYCEQLKNFKLRFPGSGSVYTYQMFDYTATSMSTSRIIYVPAESDIYGNFQNMSSEYKLTVIGE